MLGKRKRAATAIDEVAIMPCVAVHCGAGMHGLRMDEGYRKLTASVCRRGMELLIGSTGAVDATVEMMALLEDCSWTNAGSGSNLNELEEVECDASLMESSTGRCGSVGALQGCRNPIRAAAKLLELSTETLSGGRVPPVMLVGQGAAEFCEKHLTNLMCGGELVTDEARERFREHTALAGAEHGPADGIGRMRIGDESVSDESSQLHDTVGAISLDCKGVVCSAVSSGGISLKHRGRIGEAACLGAGSWATMAESSRVGVSTSGTGEHIMRSLMASRVAAQLGRGSAIEAELVDFFQSSFLPHPVPHRAKDDVAYGGVLALQADVREGFVEVGFAHSTPSMVVGWQSGGMARPKVMISRLPVTSEPGRSLLCSSMRNSIRSE